MLPAPLGLRNLLGIQHQLCNTMDRERQALLYGLIAVLLWSTVATAFKLALQEVSAIQLLWLANISSVACLAVWHSINERHIKLVAGIKQHWRPFLLLACINPALYYWVLFSAYDRLPAQLAQSINYSWAITLALLAIPFRGHKLTSRTLLALLVGYCGVVVIASRGTLALPQGEDAIGVLLALASTLLWSGYWLLNTRHYLPAATQLLAIFLLSLPFTTTLMLWFAPLTSLSFRGLLSSAYVGIFEMGITFVFWQKALQLTRNTAKISQLIFLSPFISLALIALVLGEPIYPSTLVGLLLIVAGLLMNQKQTDN